MHISFDQIYFLEIHHRYVNYQFFLYKAEMMSAFISIFQISTLKNTHMLVFCLFEFHENHILIIYILILDIRK